MKKSQLIVLMVILSFLMIGCKSNKAKGHNWKVYDRSMHITKTHDVNKNWETSLNEMKNEYRRCEDKKIKIPAGYYAQIAFLLNSLGKSDEAREYLLKEKDTYPQSAHFINSLLEIKDVNKKEDKKELLPSVLILPPLNKTIDLKASNTICSVVTKAFIKNGFYVLPMNAVRSYLVNNGMTLDEDVYNISDELLAKYFGSENVLRMKIVQWKSSTTGFHRDSMVVINYNLKSLPSGELIYEGEEHEVHYEQVKVNKTIAVQAALLLTKHIIHQLKEGNDELAVKAVEGMAAEIKKQYKTRINK